MRKICLLCLLLTSVGFYAATAQVFEITRKYNDDKTVSLYATKRYPGPVTARMEFYDVSNTRDLNNETIVIWHEGEIMKIRPIADETPRFGYTYTYVYGAVNPSRINEDLVYALPLSPHKQYRVNTLFNINERYLGEESSRAENWRAYQFIAEKGDTVFAMRTGTVVKIVDDNDMVQPGAEVSYSSKRNHITIVHKDGTEARYDVLERGSFMVREGDKIFPGTPLGKVGTYDGESYQFRISVLYRKLPKNMKLESKNITYSYIDPIFSTTEGNKRLTKGEYVTALLTDEIITAEMTKQEKKKRSK